MIADQNGTISVFTNETVEGKQVIAKRTLESQNHKLQLVGNSEQAKQEFDSLMETTQ